MYNVYCICVVYTEYGHCTLHARNLRAIMLFNFLCRKRIENILFSVTDIWSMWCIYVPMTSLRCTDRSRIQSLDNNCLKCSVEP